MISFISSSLHIYVVITIIIICYYYYYLCDFTSAHACVQDAISGWCALNVLFTWLLLLHDYIAVCIVWAKNKLLTLSISERLSLRSNALMYSISGTAARQNVLKQQLHATLAS